MRKDGLTFLQEKRLNENKEYVDDTRPEFLKFLKEHEIFSDLRERIKLSKTFMCDKMAEEMKGSKKGGDVFSILRALE